MALSSCMVWALVECIAIWGLGVAARAWVVGLVGLFSVWLVFQILGAMVGFTWGLYRFINASFADAGMPIPGDWDQEMGKLYNVFLAFWDWAPLVVFVGAMVYIILESMRRRPEEYYI